jgi:hypothetical protein
MVSSLFLLSSPLLRASALHVGVRGELGPSPSAKRDNISGLENDQNLNYMASVTLGGQQIEIVIDTGRYPSRQQLYCVSDAHISIRFCQLRSLGYEYNSECQ